MMNKFCKILMLMLLVPTFCGAQSNHIYTTQQGLETSNINSLTFDSRGLLWIASHANLGFFDGTRFHYLPNRNPENGQVYYTSINEIKEDKDGKYWLLTDAGLFHYDSNKLSHEKVVLVNEDTQQNGCSITQMLDVPGSPDEKIIVTSGYGLFYLNTKTASVDKKKTEAIQKSTQASFAVSACIDDKNQIWLAAINRQVTCFNLKTNKQVEIKMTPEAQALLSQHLVSEMIFTPTRKAIYMVTSDGVLKYDQKTQVLDVERQTLGKPYTIAFCTSDNHLLIGSDSYGVWELDEKGEMCKFEMEDQVFDLSLGKVRDIVQDKDGNLVVALLQKGIFVMPKHSNGFQYNTVSLNKDKKNSSCITSIKVDKNKHYWIATDGAGVFTTDALTLNSARPANDGLRSLLVQSVTIDANDDIWIGSYGGGVQRYNRSTARFETPAWLTRLQDMQVMALDYCKENNMLYAGTSGMGVFAIDLNSQSMERITFEQNWGAWMNAVYVDPDQILWAADISSVGSIDLKTGTTGLIKVGLLPRNPQCISSMGKGANKRILIGTSQGLAIYNPSNSNLEWKLQGVPIYSINQTEESLWLASSSCIYSIDKKTKQEVYYNSLGGYFTGEFHRSSTLDNKAGKILFGCDNGIITVTPNEMNLGSKLPNSILFTSLIIGDEEVNYSDSTSYMDANILNANKISLSHNQNAFTIHFTVPSFVSPQQIHYEYYLEGYDETWVKCKSLEASYAYYSNLPSGDYKLHVRAHLEGIPDSMEENCIRISIGAPWYDTGWAHLIYVLLAIGAIYVAYRLYTTRREQNAALQEALHNEEMKETKLRLFTSIAHELRSPLTMIISPIMQMLTTAKDESTRNNLTVMKHNCDRLLDIVKQITDIRKIDAGQFRLHFEEVELCDYTHKIAQAFLGAATAKRINFTTESDESKVSVWIDPVHFEKIIVNILSNAFKFSPEDGRILIRIKRVGGNIQLSIYNSGSNIDESDLQHIYERFYQTQNGQRHIGSGIGLNLAYELVQLHHCKISAANIQPDGVEFTIYIPSGFAHLSAEELEPREKEETTIAQQEKESVKEAITTHVETIHTEASTNEGQGETEQQTLPTLLVVDDSRDICEYLRDQLQNEYNVILAFSGNSAWNIILQNRPDVIVTDVKMPDGDGIELCKRIKSNPEFDHTPIIMLTGEGSESLQLESLNLHVDHYLQKPFNLTLLQGYINQVLGVRENMKRHIQRREINTDYESVELPSIEDQLFERINEAVQKHLDDDQFGVQELADEVGISRVHLNRKMKEKYGLSPNVFIRTYRLKQAAYLLLHKRVNVSEVAYRVGFSTHSYFSSSFREFFGMTPKDFVNYYNDPENAKKLEKLLN